MKNEYTNTCVECERKYTAKRNDSKTCSVKCRNNKNTREKQIKHDNEIIKEITPSIKKEAVRGFAEEVYSWLKENEDSEYPYNPSLFENIDSLLSEPKEFFEQAKKIRLAEIEKHKQFKKENEEMHKVINKYKDSLRKIEGQGSEKDIHRSAVAMYCWENDIQNPYVIVAELKMNGLKVINK